MTRRDRGRTSEITVKPGQKKEGALHTDDRQSHQKTQQKGARQRTYRVPRHRKRPREGRKGSNGFRRANTRETTRNPKTRGAETRDTRKRTSGARTHKESKGQRDHRRPRRDRRTTQRSRGGTREEERERDREIIIIINKRINQPFEFC